MAHLVAPFAGPRITGLAERLIDRVRSHRRDCGHPEEHSCDAGDRIAARPVRFGYGSGGSIAPFPVDGCDPALHRYLQARIGCSSEERLHVVWCGSRRAYLADETMASGSGHRIKARVRPLIERALSLGARGFLLAHNHPSGDCRPSVEDLVATRRLADLADALELELVDHLIATPNRIFSMRAAGCF